MATNIVLPAPHKGQYPVLQCKKRYRVMANGRRWGKTTIEEVLAAETAVRDALPVGWFAPNYKYLAEPYRDLKRRLAPIVVRSNHERFLELANGARIDFWTLEDPDAGRSYKYGRAIIDEAGIPKDLGQVWNNAISPTLIDYGGDAIFGGTPKGRNFFWEIFRRGQEDDSEWQSFSFPTSSNPHLPPEEYDHDRLIANGLPERTYQQEYLAEFLDEAGGVFTGVDAVIDRGRIQNEPPRIEIDQRTKKPKVVGRYSAGVDLAQVNDWTVIVILDEDGRQVFFDRFRRMPWQAQIIRISSIILEYDADVMIDATGVGSPIFEALARHEELSGAVVPFKFTAQTKAKLIEESVSIIQRQDVRLMDVRQQEEEVKAYEYQISKAGNVQMNAPEGMHDDCVIALCLALRMAAHPRIGVSVR